MRLLKTNYKFMGNLKVNIIVILITIIFLSCKRSSQSEIEWNEIPLKAEIMGYDSMFLNPGTLLPLENGLFIHGERQNSENVFSIYDFDSTNMRWSYRNPLIIRGRGPHEFITGTIITGNDGVLFLADAEQNKFYRVNNVGSDILDKSKWDTLYFPTNQKYLNSICHIEGEEFLAQLVGTNLDCMFYRFKSGDSDYAPMSLPYVRTEDTKNEKDMVGLSLSSIGMLKGKPGTNRFVYSSQYGRIVFIFTIDGLDIKIDKYLFNEPYSRNNGLDNVLGYTMATTEKYIYLASSDATDRHYVENIPVYEYHPLYYFNKVYVFDWDGNPVKQFQLDIPGGALDVDKNDRYIYCPSVNKDFKEIPLRYKLK